MDQFSLFERESLALTEALLKAGNPHVTSCAWEQVDDFQEEVLPRESQAYLKITMHRDSMEYTFWVFFAIATGLPELYVSVTTLEDGSLIIDPSHFLAEKVRILAGQPYFLTRKEHPVEAKRIAFYLH